MRISFRTAEQTDAVALATLHNSIANDLTSQYGQGPWSGQMTEKGSLYHMRLGRVLVAESNGSIIATLRLQTKKPWAIDRSYFTICDQPLYLLDMAVAPAKQRTGVGRQCIQHAIKVAHKWPADAIRLDAFDSPAGAGDFYSKCGFQEVGRVIYRGTPLLYFEMLF